MNLLVQVEEGDRESLRVLEPLHGTYVKAKRLDGAVWASMIFTVTPAATTFLVTWLKARYAKQAKTRVSVNGIVFEAFSEPEVKRLIGTLVDAGALPKGSPEE